MRAHVAMSARSYIFNVIDRRDSVHDIARDSAIARYYIQLYRNADQVRVGTAQL